LRHHVSRVWGRGRDDNPPARKKRELETADGQRGLSQKRSPSPGRVEIQRKLDDMLDHLESEKRDGNVTYVFADFENIPFLHPEGIPASWMVKGLTMILRDDGHISGSKGVDMFYGFECPDSGSCPFDMDMRRQLCEAGVILVEHASIKMEAADHRMIYVINQEAKLLRKLKVMDATVVVISNDSDFAATCASLQQDGITVVGVTDDRKPVRASMRDMPQYGLTVEMVEDAARELYNNAQPCRSFSRNGSCRFGDECNFSHDVPDDESRMDRSSTPMRSGRSSTASFRSMGRTTSSPPLSMPLLSGARSCTASPARSKEAFEESLMGLSSEQKMAAFSHRRNELNVEAASMQELPTNFLKDLERTATQHGKAPWDMTEPRGEEELCVADNFMAAADEVQGELRSMIHDEDKNMGILAQDKADEKTATLAEREERVASALAEREARRQLVQDQRELAQHKRKARLALVKIQTEERQRAMDAAFVARPWMDVNDPDIRIRAPDDRYSGGRWNAVYHYKCPVCGKQMTSMPGLRKHWFSMNAVCRNKASFQLRFPPAGLRKRGNMCEIPKPTDM